MANRTARWWFMAGAVFGLTVGGVVCLFGQVTVNEQKEVVVLATPPGTDPQMCHIVKVAKDRLAFDCALMEPIATENELPPDRLSRDAAYQTSVTVATIALFGSTTFLVVQRISKSDSPLVKIDNVLVIVGPFAFAGTHIYFAATMCCADPAPNLLPLAIASVVFLALPVFGMVGILKRKTEDK